MDSLDQFLTSSLVFALFVFPLIFYFFIQLPQRLRSNDTTKTHKEAPEAPGAWPIIGHFYLLGGRKLAHLVLGAMADKAGPIFTIRYGLHRVLVVNNSEIAKECFTVNDIAFASRPTSSASEIMALNNAKVGVAPYGQYWREQRKLMMSELLSSTRLELYKNIQDAEVQTCINELYKVWLNHDKANGPVLVDMMQWFGDSTHNVLLQMVVGKRYSVATPAVGFRRFQSATRNYLKLLGIFIIEDAFPFPRWFDLHGYKKEMKDTAKELDVFYRRLFEEHQRKRVHASEAKRELNFIDILMSKLQDVNISDYDIDTITKSNCLSVLTGGDTIGITLSWALSLLLNNRQILKKAQDELDIHVGRDRQVKESDIKNLVYLQAVLKEVLRLYPTAPLSGFRVATEDCTVAGYHVPAGTRLIVNTWKIQRDPSIWSDPLFFNPERFLTGQVGMDEKGIQNYGMIPFGAGRRVCPGITLAVQLMPLVMAHLLHGFELTTEKDMPVDMTESKGLTNAKATPLQVIITPRLRPELYEI